MYPITPKQWLQQVLCGHENVLEYVCKMMNTRLWYWNMLYKCIIRSITVRAAWATTRATGAATTTAAAAACPTLGSRRQRFRFPDWSRSSWSPWRWPWSRPSQSSWSLATTWPSPTAWLWSCCKPTQSFLTTFLAFLPQLFLFLFTFFLPLFACFFTFFQLLFTELLPRSFSCNSLCFTTCCL